MKAKVWNVLMKFLPYVPLKGRYFPLNVIFYGKIKAMTWELATVEQNVDILTVY